MDIEQILTKRELEICRMLAQGMSRERIARQLFIAEGTVKNHTAAIYVKTGVHNRAQLVAMHIANSRAITDVSISPGNDGAGSRALQAGAKLRLIGLYSLPDIIPLPLGNSGRPFIIGRFDVCVGKKQQDFEFDQDTKGVSRRHASIRRTASQTFVTDLDSRAGTFVNGKQIAPGAPCPIHHGDRVSFGYLGADYVFEDID